MSDFYLKLAATALKLLAKFGKPVILKRETGGSNHPITGVITAPVDASVTTTGLIKPYPEKMIDGTRILEGDRELVLSSEHEPLPGDRPIVNGEELTIVRIKTVKPADVSIVYFVQVRS